MFAVPVPGAPPDAARRQLLTWIAATGGAALCGPSIAAGRPQTTEPTGFYDHFTDMRLLDQDGVTLKAQSLMGRTALFNFVFTGCSTVCPIQTRALTQLQEKLPSALLSRFRQVSVSLDPLGDTPAALKSFARRMGADHKGWRFVTGRPSDIDRLSASLRLFREGTGPKKLEDHSTALWLIDTQGQIRSRYQGNPPDVARLAREIEALDQVTRARLS